MKVLSINAGSSSMKFTAYEMPEAKDLISGYIERIGIEGSFYTLTYNGEYYSDKQNNFDEKEIEKKVNEDMIINQQHINSISKEQKVVAYYTYDFTTECIRYIEEKYSYDGEVWKESYNERVIK